MAAGVSGWLGWVAASVACATVALAGPAFLPYEVDEHTLHLWHLDEAGPPFKDDGTSPTPLLGLLNGAAAGRPTFQGFGAAVAFEHPPPGPGPPAYGPILLAKPMLDIGPLDNVDAPFPVAGPDGAFTFEALVKLDTLPQDSPGLALDIVTMDDEQAENRVFLFRIEKPGFLSFLPLSMNGVRGGGLATIPTSGPHAITTGDWFHAAVTYDGRETAVNNLKLYWTRLGAGSEEAHLIGRGTLTADLSLALGDFAIGNSGKSGLLGPWEYFPGSIDEVRISSIARAPHDFCFVSEEAKVRADERSRLKPPPTGDFGMMVKQVAVDGLAVAVPSAGKPLFLGFGVHRLDVDLGFLPGKEVNPLAVSWRLEGLDEGWTPSARGMTLEWEMLDESGELLAQRVFSATGSSRGWEVDVMNSPLVERREPLFVPGLTRKIRVSMSAGVPDTTGAWIIDDLTLIRPREPQTNLWEDGGFLRGERMNQIGGVPQYWERRGTEPAIARVMQLPGNIALGLLDAEQEHSAVWSSTRDLKVRPAPGGETFLVGWSEAFNVIPGASLRASYPNVPPGSYTFRAIAMDAGAEVATSHLAFELVIRLPFWQQAWFPPVASGMGILGAGLVMFAAYRRRSRHRLADLRLRHAIEQDRARIARDMHDDLGTRVTVLNLAAGFVRRAMDGEPEKARRQLVRMESAARDLASAMEGLVWAVNPANDSLDDLAGHLAAVAQEMFRDSGIRLRIAIPDELPAVALRSDFRHHFALGVKEALHNVLKHAGPCQVEFRLFTADGALVVEIEDNGAGFDPASPREGNGLHNLKARFDELAGICVIESVPGGGTRVMLRCLVARPSTLLKS